MKTLLLNPPSFENFDGGAGSRWPARREIRSFWYPTWLAYPAGLIAQSRLLDAGPHGITPQETVEIAKDYEFLVLFTSTPGFANDLRLTEMIKGKNPHIKTAFVGPHVSVMPEESLHAGGVIDFVVRKEFDYAVAEFAWGKPLEDIQGISFRKNGQVRHTPDRPPLEDLDSLPFAVDIYKRDLDITKYNIPFLGHPYLSFYTSRGCPARCSFCLWPQTFSGHRWRTRTPANAAAEAKRAFELFPSLKEVFFDDDTFAWGKERTLAMCKELRPMKLNWSCNCRVHADYETLKGMKDAGCRLLVVGFESGNAQILKNVSKGATLEQARRFIKNCRELGLVVHGDYIIGLPGETHESIRETMRFAEEMDTETIQVSVAHPFPGTELYRWFESQGCLTKDAMLDEGGHQLPNFQYPGLSRQEIVEAVEDFYGRYYFRPKVIYRILRRAIFSKDDRTRLYREARDYLELRAKRKKFTRGKVSA